MKIIGTTEVGEGYSKSKAYVVIISQLELCKVANKSGYEHRDKQPDPKVGEDYPIAEGHDFRAELMQAVKAMQEAYTKFSSVALVASQFAGIAIAKDEAGAKGDAS